MKTSTYDIKLMQYLSRILEESVGQFFGFLYRWFRKIVVATNLGWALIRTGITNNYLSTGRLFKTL